MVELLRRYEAASSRIRVRILDPEKNPAEAQSLVEKYDITQLRVVVFDRGDDRRVVDSVDLADYDYSGMQFGQGPQLTAFKGEQMFTGSILELAESRKPKILFTTGHGELDVDDLSPRGMSQARELLGRDNFEIEGWASLGQPAVPEGTDLVVIAGPTANFIPPELAVLRSYLESGGRLLVLTDPVLSEAGGLSQSGLEELLAEYGVTLGADIVVDPANPLPFYGAETIFVSDFRDHVITRSLRQTQVPVIFPLARSVREAGPVDGFEVRELLATTSEGWGETDLAALQRVEKGDEDLAGPVPLGVAVSAVIADAAEDLEVEDLEAEEGGEAPSEEEEGAGEAEGDEATAQTRLVVLGDSDFATNGQLPNVGNAELLANAMNWLVERETLVGIPPKAPEQVRLSLTQSEMRRVTLLVLLVLPGLAVISGVAVFRRRRR